MKTDLLIKTKATFLGLAFVVTLAVPSSASAMTTDQIKSSLSALTSLFEVVESMAAQVISSTPTVATSSV